MINYLIKWNYSGRLVNENGNIPPEKRLSVVEGNGQWDALKTFRWRDRSDGILPSYIDSITEVKVNDIDEYKKLVTEENFSTLKAYLLESFKYNKAKKVYDYLELLMEEYSADIYMLKLLHDFEKSMKDIDKYVEERTT